VAVGDALTGDGGVADEERVRMVDGTTTIGGQRWRYSVSDNTQATNWAVNIHGFFAGGGVYWRESARLAARLNLRVLNPSLPGFGGSEALPWESVRMPVVADGVAALMDQLDIPAALVLGHSMGGAVAMQLAHDHPDRVTGVVYRDGVATSSWKHRHGFVSRLLQPVLPDVGDAIELIVGLMADVPDLAWSRVLSLARTAAPDIRMNARSLQGTVPIAAMLLACDFDPVTRAVAARGEIPILPAWGRWDRIVPRQTADEFAGIVDEQIEWVLGGHSWMIARPGVQLGILRKSLRGQRFMGRVARRAGGLGLAAEAS
jgi:pimeloyl-ACP methyl ester carboxylesterase